MTGANSAITLNEGAFSESVARVRFLVNKDQAPPQPANLPSDLAVYVVLRRNGKRLADAWSPMTRTQDPLASAITSACNKNKIRGASHPDTTEIVFSYFFQLVDVDKIENVFTNLNRGRIGIQLTSGKRVTRYAPTRMIATTLATGIIFLAAHAVMLSKFMGPLFRQHLGDGLIDGLRSTAAAGFYLVYLFGMVWFAGLPGFRDGVGIASLNGAILGLVAYGTYELTSWAIMRDWHPYMVAADIVWGATVTAISVTGGVLIARALS